MRKKTIKPLSPEETAEKIDELETTLKSIKQTVDKLKRQNETIMRCIQRQLDDLKIELKDSMPYR